MINFVAATNTPFAGPVGSTFHSPLLLTQLHTSSDKLIKNQHRPGNYTLIHTPCTSISTAQETRPPKTPYFYIRCLKYIYSMIFLTHLKYTWSRCAFCWFANKWSDWFWFWTLQTELVNAMTMGSANLYTDLHDVSYKGTHGIWTLLMILLHKWFLNSELDNFVTDKPCLHLLPS